MPMNNVANEIAKNESRNNVDFDFADTITLNAIIATMSNKIVSSMTSLASFIFSLILYYYYIFNIT